MGHPALFGDVFVPHFGTFRDLPISSAAPSATSAATGLTPTDLNLETNDLIDNALAIFQSGRQTRIRLSADVLFAFNKANLSRSRPKRHRARPKRHH